MSKPTSLPTVEVPFTVEASEPLRVRIVTVDGTVLVASLSLVVTSVVDMRRVGADGLPGVHLNLWPLLSFARGGEHATGAQLEVQPAVLPPPPKERAN